jgi:hypothetical protein
LTDVANLDVTDAVEDDAEAVNIFFALGSIEINFDDDLISVEGKVSLGHAESTSQSARVTAATASDLFLLSLSASAIGLPSDSLHGGQDLEGSGHGLVAAAINSLEVVTKLTFFNTDDGRNSAKVELELEGAVHIAGDHHADEGSQLTVVNSTSVRASILARTSVIGLSGGPVLEELSDEHDLARAVVHAALTSNNVTREEDLTMELDLNHFVLKKKNESFIRFLYNKKI